MLQPMALDRWSQVTIHASLMCGSIGLRLPHEGFATSARPCKSCLPISRIAIGKQSSCG
jgi:hypothetical protein